MRASLNGHRLRVFQVYALPTHRPVVVLELVLALAVSGVVVLAAVVSSAVAILGACYACDDREC